MSDRASQAELAERVAKVWDRPRLRMDTATLLEVYPNKFSWRVLGIIFGFLACEIGFFANQKSIGRAEWAAQVPMPALILGLTSLVLSILGMVKMVSGKGQYRTAQDFAEMVFVHVLGQPAAPNYHLYERVALPETLGVAPDRDDDNDDVADAADSLHAWMDRSRETISHALLERAGIEPDAQLFENAPATAAELVGKTLQAVLGPSRADGEVQVDLSGTPARCRASLAVRPSGSTRPKRSSVTSLRGPQDGRGRGAVDDVGGCGTYSGRCLVRRRRRPRRGQTGAAEDATLMV